MNKNNRYDTSSAALWASAFVIFAMIILQAGKLPSNQAHAEMASTRGAYTLLTTSSGRGGDEDPDELLYVLDSVGAVLLVYEIEDARKGQIFLRDGGSLINLFNSARQ